MLVQPENSMPGKVTVHASDSTWETQGGGFGFLDSFGYASSVDASDPSKDMEAYAGERVVASASPSQKPWMETKLGKNSKGVGASLLSPSQSCYSTASGGTAVEDSRRHLLEMIQDFPDSSFELSLKYMVDSQQVNQENEDEKVIGDTRIHETTEADHFSKERTKQDDHPILHWEGLVGESIHFKKFFPFSLSSKKKIEGEQNHSKVSPRPVLEASANSKSRKLKRQRSLGCCPFFVASSKGKFLGQ